MEIDANVYHLLNILLQVVLWSLIISAPAIILTIEMYTYERYKKWKDAEVKEKEKIILGKANETLKHDEHIKWQKDEIKKHELDVELLEKRKKSLQDELGIADEPEVKEPEEEIDLNAMNVKELKAFAKERNFKLYSKKNKQQLIKMLEE